MLRIWTISLLLSLLALTVLMLARFLPMRKPKWLEHLDKFLGPQEKPKPVEPALGVVGTLALILYGVLFLICITPTVVVVVLIGWFLLRLLGAA